MTLYSDPSLKVRHVREVLAKPLAGELLSTTDALLLLRSPSHLTSLIWEAADDLRRQLVGEVVSYVVNRNINFTSYCTKGCHYCHFSVPLNNKQGFFLSDDQLRSKVTEASEVGVTEYCIQGGIHPAVTLETYTHILDLVRETDGRPEVHIHAYSPEEVLHACNQSKHSISEVLITYQLHGLCSLPGTAAEVLHPSVREIISPHRLSVDQWVKVVRQAHSLGLPTTSTIMYGHVEEPQHVVAHLDLIRSMQMQAKKQGQVGFTEFIPLRFVNERGTTSPFLEDRRGSLVQPPPNDPRMNKEWDLKIHAVARLFLHSLIPNIQASHTKMGSTLTKEVLRAGANDLGGTLMEENITQSARKRPQEMLGEEQLIDLATAVGRPTRRRTTTYADLS